MELPIVVLQRLASVPTSWLFLSLLAVLPTNLVQSSAISHFATPGGDYDKTACVPGSHDVPNPHPQADARAPDHFYVELPMTVAAAAAAAAVSASGTPTTTTQTTMVVLEVNRTWAPIGVDRFHSLVRDHYYDCAGLFRVVPGFVVQWGIASDPIQTAKWNTVVPDDPVDPSVVSNTLGTVSFATAGPGTRTTQVFINLSDNSFLDAMGFAPFARVVGGMELFLADSNDSGNDHGLYVADPVPDQWTYEQQGNAWLLEEHPEMDIIRGLPQDPSGNGPTTGIVMSWADNANAEEETSDETVTEETKEEKENDEEQPLPGTATKTTVPIASESSSGCAAFGAVNPWRRIAMAASWLFVVLYT